MKTNTDTDEHKIVSHEKQRIQGAEKQAMDDRFSEALYLNAPMNAVLIIAKILYKKKQEWIKEVRGGIVNLLDGKYPPNIFTEYVDENNVNLVRGVRETTHLRMTNANDLKIIEVYENVLNLPSLQLSKEENEDFVSSKERIRSAIFNGREVFAGAANCSEKPNGYNISKEQEERLELFWDSIPEVFEYTGLDDENPSFKNIDAEVYEKIKEFFAKEINRN